MPLYDRPWWRDWTVWLGLFGVVAGVDYFAQNGGNGLDLALDVGFQWLLFSVVPATVRRVVRQRRSRSN